jgi:Ca2+-binding EF-hand superfamily protein
MKSQLADVRRKHPILLLCALLVVGSVVWAQWAPDFKGMGRGGYGGPENQMTEFIQSFDANGDSQIDKDEFLKASVALFDLMDLSGDGKIDAEEGRRDPAAIYGAQSRWAAQVIERYDMDEDAKLSAQEAPFGATAFARCDANKDGRLDRREITQTAFENAMLSDGLRMADNPVRVAQSFLKKYDKNRDGKIALDEFEWGENLFSQYDRNGDKILDEQEIGRIQGLPRSPKSQARELLKERDKDGNGQLSAEESGYPPEQFHAADLNADGQISLDELTTAFAQQYAPPKGRLERRLDGAPEPPRVKGEKPPADPNLPPMPKGAGMPKDAPAPKPAAGQVAPLPAPVAPL